MNEHESEQGQSHGGIYIVDPATQSVRQMLDWNTADIDWSGRGWDRGLRGIAFHDDEVYVAASDELFVFDQRFRQLRSFRNRYLKHCHEIAVHRGVLYLTSTGFDSILAFSLEKQQFTRGLYASKTAGQWQASVPHAAELTSQQVRAPDIVPILKESVLV